MKPVVSALNAWSCIVISLFAIVILSTIGGMFRVSPATSAPLLSRQDDVNTTQADHIYQQSNHHTLMGSTEDPKDGKAVAGATFSAVLVYVVRITSVYGRTTKRMDITGTRG